MCYCDEVIKFSIFNKVRTERHQFWQCLSVLPSLWKFSKKIFTTYRCPRIVFAFDVFLLLTSKLICYLVVAIVSIMYVQDRESKKVSDLQPVKI